LDRRFWVYYLIIIDRLAHQFDAVVRSQPDAEFSDMFCSHLNAYLKEGKMPPELIAGAVLNAADDYLAGRDITLRAGDYIALQNFFRDQRIR
jgi:hypothetical protein